MTTKSWQRVYAFKDEPIKKAAKKLIPLRLPFVQFLLINYPKTNH